jgi:hypothetical protein
MRALITVAVYITPFLLIGLAAKIWIKRKGVELSDVQAEGDPNRKRRARFLLVLLSHKIRHRVFV